MSKESKLYIKGANGCYQPYTPPELDISDTLYRKVNGKYVPWCKEYETSGLSDGVWVVTEYPSSKGITNGKYLRECFHLDKAADIERIPLSQIANMEKIARRIFHELKLMNTDARPMGNVDFVRTIVGMVYKLDKENI